jgi:hypothetical protein
MTQKEMTSAQKVSLSKIFFAIFHDIHLTFVLVPLSAHPTMEKGEPNLKDWREYSIFALRKESKGIFWNF